ncbi:MAG: L-fucokinase, partial [Thermoguttaceae bacterium]
MPSWDYLIVTASNAAQARAYESELAVRRKLGLLSDFGEVLVVADPHGKRVGSGGSTLVCLLEVLNRELAIDGDDATGRIDWSAVEQVFRTRRILILHAGGDSRRLPAYGPCGKIFVPVPGESGAALSPTVFDHLLQTFVPLPVPSVGCGQVVVAAGDALVRFDPAAVQFRDHGLTALGCYARPEESQRHGVFCSHGSGPVRRFLQKPSPAVQAAAGAINDRGLSILDVAVMSFGADAALPLLRAFEPTIRASTFKGDPAASEMVAGTGPSCLAFSPGMEETILSRGLDLYREICCALGSDATAEHLIATAAKSGSAWDAEMLRALHGRLRAIPFFVQVLPQCGFLHFGTTRQLIESGLELLRETTGATPAHELLSLNNALEGGGAILGSRSWVEGCRLAAPLELMGDNVVVGVDIRRPLTLPREACLDIVAGRSRQGHPVSFVRWYHIRDSFKEAVG